MNKWKKESDKYFEEEHSHQQPYFTAYLESEKNNFLIEDNEYDNLGISSAMGLAMHRRDYEGELVIRYIYNDNPAYPCITYYSEDHELRIILEYDIELYRYKYLHFNFKNGLLYYGTSPKKDGSCDFAMDTMNNRIFIIDEYNFHEVLADYTREDLKKVFSSPFIIKEKMKIPDFKADSFSYSSDDEADISECSGPNTYGVGVIDQTKRFMSGDYYKIKEFYNHKPKTGWRVVHSDYDDIIAWDNENGKDQFCIKISRDDDDIYMSIYFGNNDERPLIKYEGPSGYLFIGQSDNKYRDSFKGPGLRFDVINGESIYINFKSTQSASFVARSRFDEDYPLEPTSRRKEYYKPTKGDFSNYIKEHPEHFTVKRNKNK